MRWSEEDYQDFLKRQGQTNLPRKNKKKSKYNNRKVTVDGIKFDSEGEARRYGELKILQATNMISDLELQPKFELQPTFKKNGETFRSITYKADFRYKDEHGKIIIEDFKGMETQVFINKKKMFEYKYPDLSLKIIK